MSETKRMFCCRSFHWRFWRPLSCVGGIIRFGFFYDCWFDGQYSRQTPFQFELKRRDGLWRQETRVSREEIADVLYGKIIALEKELCGYELAAIGQEFLAGWAAPVEDDGR